MDALDCQDSGAPAALLAQARPPLPYVVRRRQARLAAGARAAARTTVHVTAAQRVRDPLASLGKRRTPGWLRGSSSLLGSIAVHAAIVAVGFLTGGLEKGQREIVEQKINIQVHEAPPPPPLPPEPPQLEKPEPTPPPRVAKAPPPKAPPIPEPPAEPDKTPPPRVIGLSMESTAEGGSGPAFAVGNTRMGKTADRATNPDEVPKEAPGAEPLPGQNQVASRLPSAGVKYTPPKRKRDQDELARALASLYPSTLKAQGIEADVKVSLAIDATGKVTAVKILTPAAFPEFNEAARTAGLAEEFEPALRDGSPIPYSLPFTYRFRLEDE